MVLVVAILGWFSLSVLACHLRVQNADTLAKGMQIGDYSQGKSWATELLGIAATLAGFLGITRATQDVNLSDGTRAQIAGGGMAGILAGATLAGVGGLPVPIGLATMAAGATTVGIVYMLRRLR